MKFCFFPWVRNEPGVGDSSQRASNATHIDKVCHATIPSAGERQLRVVSHYKHLGAIKATTARLNPELMARCGAASLAKRAVSTRVVSAPSTHICLRLAVASAIHSSLLYASIMWPKFPCAVYRALAAAYAPPLRKAVNRQWPPKRPGRPLGRDEVLLRACCFVTIFGVARGTAAPLFTPYAGPSILAAFVLPQRARTGVRLLQTICPTIMPLYQQS